MTVEYALRAMSEDRVARVSREWADISGGDEFEVELAPVFSWCMNHLEHREGYSYALEMYSTHHGETAAILEMVNSKRGALFKMLKFHASPKFWVADTDDAILEELIQLYFSAFVHVISSGMDGGFDEIKIYGRNATMFVINGRLQELWIEGDTGWSASIQGRWLSFSKNRDEA